MADASTLRHFIQIVEDGQDIAATDLDSIAAFDLRGAVALHLVTTRDSMDEAIAFKETMLPGWYWRAGHGTLHSGWAHLNRFHPDHCDRLDEATAYAGTPARSLVVATLKACLALAEARHG